MLYTYSQIGLVWYLGSVCLDDISVRLAPANHRIGHAPLLCTPYTRSEVVGDTQAMHFSLRSQDVHIAFIAAYYRSYYHTAIVTLSLWQ